MSRRRCTAVMAAAWRRSLSAQSPSRLPPSVPCEHHRDTLGAAVDLSAQPTARFGADCGAAGTSGHGLHCSRRAVRAYPGSVSQWCCSGTFGRGSGQRRDSGWWGAAESRRGGVAVPSGARRRDCVLRSDGVPAGATVGASVQLLPPSPGYHPEGSWMARGRRRRLLTRHSGAHAPTTRPIQSARRGTNHAGSASRTRHDGAQPQHLTDQPTPARFAGHARRVHRRLSNFSSSAGCRGINANHDPHADDRRARHDHRRAR